MNKEKKILIKFLAIVIASLLLGFFMGYSSMAVEKDIAAQIQHLLDSMVKAGPVMMLLGCVILAVAVVYCNKGRLAAATALAGDDEEKYEDAEHQLSVAINITNRLTIYLFAVFGIIASGFGTGYEMDSFMPVMGSVGLFLALLLGTTFLQNIIIKQVQKLNPEKKGNVMDTNFHREWFESCDEAEKMQIGNAAYRSYRATSNAIVGAILIAMFVSMMTPAGPLPSILVCGIWAVQFASYAKAANEWEKKK